MHQTSGTPSSEHIAPTPADARDAARLASLRRLENVTLASPSSSGAAEEANSVRLARKELLKELHLMPDYLHYSPNLLLDAVNLLLEICGKTKNHIQKSDGTEFKVNAAVFERKTHAIPHTYEALLRLGFRPRVIDMKKFAVHEGVFKPEERHLEERFLEEAMAAILTTKTGVETHVHSIDAETTAKKAAEEVRRQRALMAFEEDRASVQKRLQREG